MNDEVGIQLGTTDSVCPPYTYSPHVPSFNTSQWYPMTPSSFSHGCLLQKTKSWSLNSVMFDGIYVPCTHTVHSLHPQWPSLSEAVVKWREMIETRGMTGWRSSPPYCGFTLFDIEVEWRSCRKDLYVPVRIDDGRRTGVNLHTYTYTQIQEWPGILHPLKSSHHTRVQPNNQPHLVKSPVLGALSPLFSGLRG